VNFDAALPRAGTQHYPPLIEVNYCAHVLAVDTLERLGSVIGQRPLLLPLPLERAFEINTPFDFELAQWLYHRTPPPPLHATSSVCTAQDLTSDYGRTRAYDRPWPHFVTDGFLPRIAYDAAARHAIASDNADCDGTRTTVANRFFLTPTTATPELAPIIAFFRDGRDALARDYGVDLTDTYLRIELAADTEEFWQVPHIDTKEKRITIIVFLTSDHPGDLGTDLGTSNATDAQRTRVPWAENRALVFRTAPGRWYSFTKRSFVGVRRVLLANFVEAANWRSLDQVWDLDAVDVK
jgi:hypothetical protein